MSSPTPVLVGGRPTLRFMLAHPARLIALGFGSGLPRVAPGTFGTLWAWLAYLAARFALPPEVVVSLDRRYRQS